MLSNLTPLLTNHYTKIFNQMETNPKLAISLISNLAIIITITCQVIPQGCQEKCGNVQIPYPFGIGKGCALEDKFLINCNNSYNPPKPFLQGSSHSIISISLDGHLTKFTYVASDCYNKTGGQEKDHSNYIARSRLEEFYYSPRRNKFTAIGCDTEARLAGSSHRELYASGCISVCYNRSSVINGSCSGIGCCQTSIPQQLSKFNVTLSSFENHTLVRDFNPCSYAFIIDADLFEFSTVHLVKMPDQVPAVLDWVVGNLSCELAVKNKTSYACQEHSECRDSDNGSGYRCFCSPGYRGNPYVPNGCVDINECEDPLFNNCTHKCHNTLGNYTCSCPNWFQGDGRRNGEGCSINHYRIFHLILGVGISLIVLAIGGFLLNGYTRRRMLKRVRKNFFKQNGGLILQDRIFKCEGSINSIRIFISQELEKATDNFCESNICGRGGFGIVYKGCLLDGTLVAIKKPKIVDQSQIELFINEITILSQINHRNVVRFLGCCLETPVPLLVYEFITNGTLFHHLNNETNRLKMSWQIRLKIAAETAGVLAYLHSAHHTPIIHRDIKPTNILLDDDYTAKVSDFGASRLIPKNEHTMCTMVQGTLGYLDPEYFRTSQLTEKSDVYSFGVVLAELLTGLKAISFNRQEDDWSLVNYFLSMMEEDRILEITDKGIIKEDNIDQIVEIAKVAEMCLKVKGEERPSMKEVAMELDCLQMELKHKDAINDSNIEKNEQMEALEMVDNHGGSSIPKGECTSGEGDDILTLKIDDGR